MRITGLRLTQLALALALGVSAVARAAPPLEPLQVRVAEVDVAGREILADGITWALESTVAIHAPGKKNASLQDLAPGMHVRLDFAPTDGPEPLVRTITVLPD
jgi:hypothetical protein